MPNFCLIIYNLFSRILSTCYFKSVVSYKLPPPSTPSIVEIDLVQVNYSISGILVIQNHNTARESVPESLESILLHEQLAWFIKSIVQHNETHGHFYG